MSKGHKGFSLTEILVTLMLLGMTVGILMSGYNNLRSMAEETAGRHNTTALSQISEAYHLTGGNMAAIFSSGLTAHEQAAALTLLMRSSDSISAKQRGQVGHLLSDPNSILVPVSTSLRIGDTYLAPYDDGRGHISLKLATVTSYETPPVGFVLDHAKSSESKKVSLYLPGPINKPAATAKVERAVRASLASVRQSHGARYADFAQSHAGSKYIWNTDETSYAGPGAINPTTGGGATIPAPERLFLVVSYSFERTGAKGEDTTFLKPGYSVMNKERVIYELTEKLTARYQFPYYQFDDAVASPTTATIYLSTSNGEPANWSTDVDIYRSVIRLSDENSKTENSYRVGDLLSEFVNRSRQSNELKIRLPAKLPIDSSQGFRANINTTTGLLPSTDFRFNISVSQLQPSSSAILRGIQKDNGGISYGDSIPTASALVTVQPARLGMVIAPASPSLSGRETAKAPNGQEMVNVTRYLNGNAYEAEEFILTVFRSDGLPLTLADLDLQKGTYLSYQTGVFVDHRAGGLNGLYSQLYTQGGMPMSAPHHWSQAGNHLQLRFKPSESLLEPSFRYATGVQFQFSFQPSQNALQGGPGRQPIVLPLVPVKPGTVVEPGTPNVGRNIMLNGYKP